MCGIAGFVGATCSAERQQGYLEAMLDALRHRGPDEQGLWQRSADGTTVALAHARLSIIDLSSGHQPMHSASGRLTIVFNGEIYNYRTLRDELEAKGHQFRTRSDTEVILAQYLESGVDCVQYFEGMFAFAIWDEAEQTLFAARDRMGKKPFYYTLQQGVFAFGSELGALTRLDFMNFVVEREAMAAMLAHGYVPTPRTIYRQVCKLRPAHMLLYAKGEIRTAPYWELPLPRPYALDEDECMERLFTLCQAATARRLIADVPLGAFLSGGIDSSVIVGLMSRVCDEPVKTFSIGYAEKSYDESPHARAVASAFGTQHTAEILSAVHTSDLLPEIVARLDEPMSDPSIVPTYLLSRITRKHVTVALSGDGGDELFGGYEHYLGFIWTQRLRRLGPLATLPLAVLKKLAPASTGYVSPRHILERVHWAVTAPPWLATQKLLQTMDLALQRQLWLDPPANTVSDEALYAETRHLYASFPADEPLDRVFYLFFRQYLLDEILFKVDRCSMMHALEVRSPLLDREVVEFAFALPASMKIRGMTRKYLLKKTFNSMLPPGIANRKKVGFIIPTGLWLKDRLGAPLNELLGADWLKRQGLFDAAAIARLRAEHDAGQADHREELWTLLVLQLWLQAHSPRIG